MKPYSKPPFIQPTNDWVVVWVGDLNEDELFQYLIDPLGPDVDDDGEPLPEFECDLGFWYDVDERALRVSDTAIPLGELCDSSFAPPEITTRICCEADVDRANCVMLLWNSKIIEENSRVFASGRLRAIGNWQHESPYNDPIS